MGYTTEFEGVFRVEPPLNEQEIDYLDKFADTRRMKRTSSPYFVEGTGICGQDEDDTVIDSNQPPEGQPGLWCQWVPDPEEADAIIWDGGEKFYNAAEWIEYLIAHFIGPDPIAKTELPFLQGHTVNGEVEAHGEDSDDHWMIDVTDSVVTVKEGKVVYE